MSTAHKYMYRSNKITIDNDFDAAEIQNIIYENALTDKSLNGWISIPKGSLALFNKLEVWGIAVNVHLNTLKHKEQTLAKELSILVYITLHNYQIRHFNTTKYKYLFLNLMLYKPPHHPPTSLSTWTVYLLWLTVDLFKLIV